VLTELASIHYHHEMPFANLVPCDSPHRNLPKQRNNRHVKATTVGLCRRCGVRTLNRDQRAQCPCAGLLLLISEFEEDEFDEESGEEFEG
jgi:hypothetical protein